MNGLTNLTNPSSQNSDNPKQKTSLPQPSFSLQTSSTQFWFEDLQSEFEQSL